VDIQQQAIAWNTRLNTFVKQFNAPIDLPGVVLHPPQVGSKDGKPTEVEMIDDYVVSVTVKDTNAVRNEQGQLIDALNVVNLDNGLLASYHEKIAGRFAMLVSVSQDGLTPYLPIIGSLNNTRVDIAPGAEIAGKTGKGETELTSGDAIVGKRTYTEKNIQLPRCR